MLGLVGETRRWLIAILLLSVALRVGVALYLGDVVDAPPMMTDQRSYHALGERLLGGYGYSFAGGWYPFTPPNTPTAHWSFLYAAFVALVYTLFGVHPLAVRLVQAILGGMLLPWMVCRLSKRLFPHRGCLALLSAALAACYGYFVLYAATLMTETFYIVLVLWSLETSLRLTHVLRAGWRAPWRLSVELGLSLGLATLMRQSILPWAPVLFLWLWWQGWLPRVQTVNGLASSPDSVASQFVPFRGIRGKLSSAATLPLALAGLLLSACILPFTLRNYRVYGEFLLLNSNTGYAMYSAQHPMHGATFREFDAAPLPADLRGLNEAQLDRELLRRGIRFVLDDPGRYALLSLSRLRAYLEFWPSRDTSLLHNIGRVGSFGLYLPFMLYGYYYAVRSRLLGGGNWLIVLFVVCYSLMHLLTWAMVRYRLPVDAVSMPFAALAVDDLVRRLRPATALRSDKPGDPSVPVRCAPCDSRTDVLSSSQNDCRPGRCA
jgi:hypothetical protein